MPPKVNCAIYSAQLVYVCVLAYDLGLNAEFRLGFPGESCYLQLAVCIFASQSELRHLQCMVSVCVCVHMILGQMPNFGKFFPVNPVIYSSLCAFLPPKVNCAICSPKLVYVCVLAYDFGSNAQFR